mgnify:CR=1 FL=1
MRRRAVRTFTAALRAAGGPDFFAPRRDRPPSPAMSRVHQVEEDAFPDPAVGDAQAADRPGRADRDRPRRERGSRARVHDAGGLRSQFSHLTDIAPTVYEAAGITPPDVVDGVKQMKLEGISLFYSFDHPDVPSRHHIQYFETNGNKAQAARLLGMLKQRLGRKIKEHELEGLLK